MPKYKSVLKANKSCKVSALRYTKKMEQPNLQTLYNNFHDLEQRVNALQQENENLTQQLNQQQQQPPIIRAAPEPVGQAQNDFFRIPDPIKTIPSFDGNKKQLASWLATAQKTLAIFENIVTPAVYSVYEQTIINKIEGKARDTICVNGNPSSFDEVSAVLKAIYGDKNDMATYQTQMWSLKMDESIHLYYRRTKEILQNMKSLAKQKELYQNHWEAISDFLDQECLAAFINGLNKQYFGYAQAAKPEDLESAYAFLCKFQNAENTKKHTSHPVSYSQKTSGKPFNKSEQRYINVNKPPSERQKITPMEIDPSIRSNTRNPIYNHTADDPEKEHESDQSNQTDDESEELNFQIAPGINVPR